MPSDKGGQDVNFDADNVVRMTPQVYAGGLNITTRKLGNSGKTAKIGVFGKPTAERTTAVRGMSDALANKASEFGLLRQDVRPGFGRLTASRLAELEDARRRRIGDVGQALSRRRILGSNFARDEISREELTFTKERDRITAESYLQELAASVDLVGKEFDSRAQSFQVLLDELNLESSAALSMATGVQQVYANMKAQAMQLEAESKQQSAGGLNSLFGNLLGTATGIGASYLTAPQQIVLSGGGAPSSSVPGLFSSTSLGPVT